MRGTAVVVFVGAILTGFAGPRYAYALDNPGYCSAKPGGGNYINLNNPTGSYAGFLCTSDPTDCPNGQGSAPDGSLLPCVANQFSAYIKPEIVPIFWDSSPTYWNAPPSGTHATRVQVMAYLQYLVNSAYFGPLSQYNVSPPRLAPVAPIDSSYTLPTISTWNTHPCYSNGPQGGCGTYYAQYEINAAIAAGVVPPPTAGADMMYVVMVPVLPGDQGEYGGGYGAGSCPFTDPTGYVHYCGSYGTLSQPLPYRFAYQSADDPLGTSHEIVEGLVMEPDGMADGGTQPVKNCAGATSIADLCGQCDPPSIGGWNANHPGPTNEAQNGHWLAAYYSRQDGACVIPEGWPGVWSWNASRGTWFEMNSATIRQYATSGPNIVFEDDNGSVYSYTDTGGLSPNWTWIDQAPDMIAISGTATSAKAVVYAANGPNGPYIAQTPMNVSSWTSYSPPGSVVSGLVSGVDTLATDEAGNAYFLAGSTWQKFGGPYDQYVGTGWGPWGHAVFALNWKHDGVVQSTPGVSSWSDAGAGLLTGGVTQLFANPASDLVVATDANFNIWSHFANPAWVYQTWNIADSLAVEGGGSGGGNYNLWWLKKDRTQQSYDSDPSAQNGSWTQIQQGVLGRIIGASNAGAHDTLYAFGCQNDRIPSCVVYCKASGGSCDNPGDCCSGTCNGSGVCQ